MVRAVQQELTGRFEPTALPPRGGRAFFCPGLSFPAFPTHNPKEGAVAAGRNAFFPLGELRPNRPTNSSPLRSSR